MPDLYSPKTYITTLDTNGQISIFEMASGDLSSAMLNQLFTAQRDISGASKLLEALMIRNIS